MNLLITFLYICFFKSYYTLQNKSGLSLSFHTFTCQQDPNYLASTSHILELTIAKKYFSISNKTHDGEGGQFFTPRTKLTTGGEN